MPNNIRIVIADDIRDTRESIRRILSLDTGFEVIGEAACGSDAIRLTELLKPDIVLMDINMPDIDGIKTAELLSFRAPNTSVIMMSVQTDPESMTKSMLAGAKAYIAKPFTSKELTSTILNVFHKEARKRELMSPAYTASSQEKDTSEAKILSVFSTKGGVGKTTTAVNLAVELTKYQSSKTLLIDLNLQFGDIPSFLNLVPKRTIADLAQSNTTKYEDISYHILTHSSGVQVLASSTRPEYAEMITPEIVSQILEEVKLHYDFVIIDNTSFFDDISLAGMDAADIIMLIAGMDIPAIKNTKLCLEVLYSLEHSQKIKLILNKFNKKMGIPRKDIESSLGMKASYIIPEEEQITPSLNKGIPFIEAHPRSTAAQEIKRIAKDLLGTPLVNTVPEEVKTKDSSLPRVLGLGT